jgi:hypothetical protein
MFLKFICTTILLEGGFNIFRWFCRRFSSNFHDFQMDEKPWKRTDFRHVSTDICSPTHNYAAFNLNYPDIHQNMCQIHGENWFVMSIWKSRKIELKKNFPHFPHHPAPSQWNSCAIKFKKTSFYSLFLLTFSKKSAKSEILEEKNS